MNNVTNKETSIKILSRIQAMYDVHILVQSKKSNFNIKHLYNNYSKLIVKNETVCDLLINIVFYKGINHIVIYSADSVEEFNITFSLNIYLNRNKIPYTITTKKYYSTSKYLSTNDFFNNPITNDLLKVAKNSILTFSEKIKKYKNILFFCTDYPNHGGASTNCIDLMNYYSDTHNVYGIFYTLENKEEFNDKYCVINIKNLIETVKNLTLIPDLIILKNFVPTNLINLKNHFDCQVYFLVPGIFSENLDKPYDELDTVTEFEQYVDRNVISQIFLSDQIYCNSSHTQNILYSKYGIDSHLFCSGFIKYQNHQPIILKNIKKKYDYVFVVSKLNRSIKNTKTTINFLINVKKQNKDTNVVVIGRGSHNYTNLGFECYEQLSNTEILNIFTNTTYVMQDSFYESCSNVKIEAFFCGCVFLNSKKAIPNI